MWMKKQGRIIAGYSAQVAADEASGMVVAVKATRAEDDRRQLTPMIKAIERTAGSAAEQLVADNGYYTEEGLVEAAGTSTAVLVPAGQQAAQLNRHGALLPLSQFHVDGFHYEASEQSFTCPAGHKLRVLKRRRRRGVPTVIYRGTQCRSCAHRAECTKARQGFRTIEVPQQYAVIRQAHERFRSPEAQAAYRGRKTIIEPIFGQWQYNRGVRRLRLRGLNGFDRELHLLAIGHNLQKFQKWGLKVWRN